MVLLLATQREIRGPADLSSGRLLEMWNLRHQSRLIESRSVFNHDPQMMCMYNKL